MEVNLSLVGLLRSVWIVFGHDVFIGNNANTTSSSYSNLGKSYKHPQYAYRSNEAETFLAGSYQFRLDEIEVYQKE
jgi:hypothetical protein